MSAYNWPAASVGARDRTLRSRWLGSSTLLAVVLLAVAVSACTGSGDAASTAPPATNTAASTGRTPAIAVPDKVRLQASPNGAGPTTRFEHLSIEQGLSQSSVYVIHQDSKGFMWFGTDDGLNRYDGYQFHIFRHDPDDPGSLDPGGIRRLHEDGEGRLWVATLIGALDRYDRAAGSFIHYRRSEGGVGNTPGDYVSDLLEDRDGDLWVGMHLGGLYRYDPNGDRFVAYRHDPAEPGSLGSDRVNDLYEDAAGDLWIGTDTGLDRLDAATDRFTHFRHDPADPATLANNRVTAILEDTTGRFWVATAGTGLNLLNRADGRVVRFLHDPADPASIDKVDAIVQMVADQRGTVWVRHGDGRLDRLDPATGVFTRFRYQPEDEHSLNHDHTTFVYEDRGGNIWVGTWDGLARWDSEAVQFVRYRNLPYDPDSLSDNQPLTVHEDRSGCLWFGTFGHGVNRLDLGHLKFAHYLLDPQAPDGVQNNIVFGLLQDRNGVIWIGTVAGLNSLDRATGELRRFRHDPNDPSSLGAGTVRTLLEDSRGDLWIGTDRSLDRLDRTSGRFDHFRPAVASGEVPGAITALLESPEGGLWVALGGQGLMHFDPVTGVFVRYELPGGASPPAFGQIWDLCLDRVGTLWVGTTGGLIALDVASGALKRYGHVSGDPSSLSHDSVMTILEDSAGRLWLGTMGGGLNRLDRKTGLFTHYTVADGLPNNSIYGILEDGEGHLWLSTNNGLVHLDPETSQFRTYDAGDGLQSNEFNAWAYDVGVDGELLFGGVNGFNAFDPDNLWESSFVPPVILTGLTLEGATPDLGVAVEDATELVVAWPDSGFEFEFAALSFSRPERNQYTYMLEGFDRDWNNAGSRRFGDYTNLPGGTYTLRMKAASSDGVWNEQGASLKVTVVPPFWATWWFRFLVLVTLGVAAFVGYRLRVRSVTAHNRALEAEVSARTREIEERRQELEGLYRADAELYSRLQATQVLQTLVQIAVDVWHADVSLALTWNAAHQCLTPAAAQGFTAGSLAQRTFDPWEGVIGRVMSTCVPVIADPEPDADIDASPLAALLQAEGIVAVIVLPITLDSQIDGLFLAGYSRPHTFGEDEQRLFTALAQRAALAIQNARYFDAEHRRADQFQVLVEIGRRIGAIMDVDELLQQVVAVVQQTFGYYHVGIGLVEGDEVVYRVGAGKLWQDQGFQFHPARLKVGRNGTGAEGISGWVVGTGEPRSVPDVRLEPQYVWMEGSRTLSELVAPIFVKGQVIGALDVQSDRVDAFDATDLAVLQTLAHQVGAAIENAQLYEQAQQAAVLEERGRLARDLHDAVTQTLFSATLLAEVLPDTWEMDRAEGKALLRELKQLSRGALAEMRTLLLELRPAVLAQADLADLMRQLSEAASGRTGIPVEVKVEGTCELAEEIRIALYRIAQEALHNVVKHAHATRVRVSLRCRSLPAGTSAGQAVELVVSDDGIGFDPAQTPPDRLGLHILAERAAAAGARLEITSRPGAGTQVRAVWPAAAFDLFAEVAGEMTPVPV